MDREFFSNELTIFLAIELMMIFPSKIIIIVIYDEKIKERLSTFTVQRAILIIKQRIPFPHQLIEF